MDPQPTQNKAAIVVIAFLLLLTPISFFAARNYRSQFSRASSTPLTAPEPPSGPLGYAAKFDNPTITLRSFAYSSPSAELKYNNPSTVEMWFKAYSTQPYGYPAPLFIRSSGDSIYFTQSTAGTPLKLTYMLPNGTGTIGDTSIQYDKWYHVALVIDGSLARLYINGNLEMQQKDDVLASMPDPETILLGRTWGGSLSTASQIGYNGEIDELRVSNVARYSANFIPQTVPFNSDKDTSLLLHFENSLADSSFNTKILNPVNLQYVLNNNTQNTPIAPSITPTAYIAMPSPTYPPYVPTPTLHFVTITPTAKIYPTITPVPTYIPTVTPLITDRPGVYRPKNNFLLRNSLTEGVADIMFTYGLSGDKPLMGDWDNNGTDTVGVFRNGAFYLRNSNTTGNSDLAFLFGSKNDLPLVGDWNGDGKDTIGVYRQGTFHLKNTNTSGKADILFSFGTRADIPLVGDWNGDGIDTVGIYSPSNSTFYLRNTNTPGNPDIIFSYGLPGDKPVIGDWNGDKIDTVAMYRNGVYYIRNSNSNGFAEITIPYGAIGDTPLAGKWKK